MAYTTIDDPALYFNTVLYTGDIVDGDGTGHDQVITGVGFAPNLLWHKGRNQARLHILADSVRGTGGSPTQMVGISSQDTNAEISTNSYGWIESLDSDGFTVTAGDDSSSKSNNSGANTNTYVAWCWKETATAGFDILLYTGDGANRTISHSLSAVPHFFITKKRSDTSSWKVYHQGSASSPEDVSLSLQGTGAVDDDATYYNDTAPTSSVFSLGTNEDLNADSATFVAYLWTGIQGFSKFGSYTGNGNADGPFIYTGFAPAFVLWKAYNGSLNWIIEDSKRNIAGLGYLNGANSEELYPNVGTAETQAGGRFDFLSNGLKVRDSSSADINGSNSFIYMAFAEAPFVNSNGVPCNAK